MIIIMKRLPPVDPHIVDNPSDYNMGAEAQFNLIKEWALGQGHIVEEESCGVNPLIGDDSGKG